MLATAADYDSGWISDNNSSDHEKSFEHHLGVVPSRITVYFSADQLLAFVATSNTSSQLSFNPEGVCCDDKYVRMWITERANLFDTIDFINNIGHWVGRTRGYWRVFAWR